MKTKEEELNEYFEKNSIVDENTKEYLRNKFLNGIQDEIKEAELITNKVEHEKKRFWDENRENFENVNTLIAFASLSNQKKAAFLKTIDIFEENIKNLILISTEQTRDEAEKIKIHRQRRQKASFPRR